ncbi:MAG: ATP-dependent DNA helicase [Candidatus Thermoplasmatota archaeon]|jgi:DNA excision repair protein ERCC-2|nr:ATP-dependent DNA helicase [Candidatus Thermoplasmatota archaeon]MCL5791102.1 ATP-dependent DNA helicase [Candidatus Thermoplasmatota archaeon]
MESIREDGRYGSIELRPYQVKAIDFAIKTLMEGKHAIIESPTGSGKTLISLFSAILYAKSSGRRVIYLTRTNSQQANILKEINLIKESISFRSVVMQGRINLCPLYMEIEKEKDLTAESLSKMCSSRKRKTMEKKDGGCRYYNEGIREQSNIDMILEHTPSPEDLFTSFSSRGICPYETMKYAMKDADIVVMPYSYFISPDMAMNVLYNMRTSRESVILVIDEAHNLPDLARQVNSFEITWNMVNLSERESQDFGDPEIMPRVRVSDFTESIRSALIDISSDMPEGMDEKRIMFRDVYSYIAMAGRYNPEDVEYMADALSNFGNVVENQKEKMGRVPMSHISSLASKLKFLQYADDDRYVCIVRKGEKSEDTSVEAYCLDPSIILEQMRRSLSVHVSATLEPLEIYVNMTGFTDNRFLKIGRIFPEENLLSIYDNNLTTKYESMDGSMEVKIARRIGDILEKAGKRALVLFPSFNIMQRILRHAGQYDADMVERRDLKSAQFNRMIGRFRKEGGTMYGVIGGRMSEGIDLPGKLLEVLIIVGIPFPRPDIRQKILSSYYDHEFGNGWEYAFLFPAIIRLKQAMGRVIRSDRDRGVIVILDSRVRMFSEYIDSRPASDDLHEITDFFRKAEKK